MTQEEAVQRIEKAFKHGISHLDSKSIDRRELALFWQGAGMGAYIAKQLTEQEVSDFIDLTEKEWTKVCEDEKCSNG